MWFCDSLRGGGRGARCVACTRPPAVTGVGFVLAHARWAIRSEYSTLGRCGDVSGGDGGLCLRGSDGSDDGSWRRSDGRRPRGYGGGGGSAGVSCVDGGQHSARQLPAHFLDGHVAERAGLGGRRGGLTHRGGQRRVELGGVAVLAHRRVNADPLGGAFRMSTSLNQPHCSPLRSLASAPRQSGGPCRGRTPSAVRAQTLRAAPWAPRRLHLDHLLIRCGSGTRPSLRCPPQSCQWRGLVCCSRLRDICLLLDPAFFCRWDDAWLEPACCRSDLLAAGAAPGPELALEPAPCFASGAPCRWHCDGRCVWDVIQAEPLPRRAHLPRIDCCAADICVSPLLSAFAQMRSRSAKNWPAVRAHATLASSSVYIDP